VRDCKKPAPVLFLKDHKGAMFRMSKRGTFTNVSLRNIRHTKAKLLKLHSFNRKIMHTATEGTPQLTLLGAIDEGRMALEKMADLSGDQLDDFVKVVGSEGGSIMTKLAKETKRILKEGKDSILDPIKTAGMYIGIALLIIILLYVSVKILRCWNRRGGRNEPDV
jgi:hypothetical protein